MLGLLLLLLLLFRGASQASNSSDAMAQLEQLKERLMVLEEEEKRLEEQYVRMKQCLRNLSEDTSDNQYPTHVVLDLLCIAITKNSLTMNSFTCFNP